MEEEPVPKVTYTVTFEFTDHTLQVIHSEGGVQEFANRLQADLGIALVSTFRKEADRSVLALELHTTVPAGTMTEQAALQRSAFEVFDWFSGHGVSDPHLIHAGFRTMEGSEPSYFEPISDEVFHLFDKLARHSADVDSLLP